MKASYFFSSQTGDIPIDEITLKRPFLIKPAVNHPHLKLGDYFQALRRFILGKNGAPLLNVLCAEYGTKFFLDDIKKIIIRSEKHGVFYHLASVEIFFHEQHIRFAVSSAISEAGKDCLNREFALLNHLNRTLPFAYLPKVYLKGEVACGTGKRTEVFAMFLAQWFEGYHEWHYSRDKKTGQLGILVWDIENGYRSASQQEAYNIHKEASKILTLYYDTRKFDQIYPWHHAAGDFVVKIIDGDIDLKLITVRKYEPFMAFRPQGTLNPLTALVYFFLNLTVKMRLDKLDGIGEAVWAEDFVVEAVTDGFFEAALYMENNGMYHIGRIRDMLSLLKGFDRDELRKVFNSLLEFYRQEEPGDFILIERNLRTHAFKVHRVIKEYRL